MAISPANAASVQTLTEVPLFCFKSLRAGGEQIDGALAISIYNSGSGDLFVHVNGLHGTADKQTPPAEVDLGTAGLEYGRIPSGTSATFEVVETAGNSQIDWVVLMGDVTSTTADWMVTKRR